MSHLPSKVFTFFQNLFNNNHSGPLDQQNQQPPDLASYISSAQKHTEIILVFSLEGKVISENERKVNEFLGYPPKKELDFQKLFSNEDYTRLQSALLRATKGSTEHVQVSVHHKNSAASTITGIFFPIKTEQGRISAVSLILKNDAIQKQLEIQLLELNKKYKHIFDHLHVGVWMRRSIDGNITFASKGLAKLLQIPLDTIYEDPDYWRSMVLPMYQEELFEKHQLLLKGESIEHEYRINAGDGTTKWVYEQTIPKVNDQGEVTDLFGMVIDITDRIDIQQKLEYLSKHHAITALPNYYSFSEKMIEFIQDEHVPMFAVIYLDLDNFYQVNELLGFQMGDLFLKRIANRLLRELPEKGHISHINNNEFVFIVPNYESKKIIFELAERIIERVRERITIKGYELYITTSIGISFYPENGEEKLMVMENAHSALYRAKKRGKNNYQTSFAGDIHSHKKYMLERDLRQAIANEDFELYYQPQVEPQSGVIKGAEALIRWNHEDWGVVSPGEFIPLAEEKHLIQEIERWVIRTVCLQLQKWKEQGLTLYPIAINISPIHFLQGGIAEDVKKHVSANGVSAKYLEIEITESSFLHNEDGVLSALNELKELGVKIALDDFGTGFATFHYLKQLHIDTLKIDRSFIRDIHLESKSDAAIVSSIVHLAKELDMNIVAEGVEEVEQMEFLRQRECDTVQGYLYSKPVPVDEYTQILQTGYLLPKVQHTFQPEQERRKYFRFQFQDFILAKMEITEVNNRKVDLGSADILVENISLGGLKILSSLSLPVNPNFKLKFNFCLMNEPFELEAKLIWKNEDRHDTYFYGVEFQISENERDELAEVVNKMTVIDRQNKVIPGMDFVEGNPYAFFKNK